MINDIESVTDGFSDPIDANCNMILVSLSHSDSVSIYVDIRYLDLTSTPILSCLP